MSSKTKRTTAALFLSETLLMAGIATAALGNANYQSAFAQPADCVELAVNGTLMRGLELEPNLVNLGATFVGENQTEPAYGLCSLLMMYTVQWYVFQPLASRMKLAYL